MNQQFQLYQGDCLKALPTIKAGAADLVFIDPPYGNNTSYSSYQDSKENLKYLIDGMMSELFRITTRVAITCGVANIHLYPAPDWILCWHSPAGAGSSQWGFCCWQPILVYGKDPYLSNGLGRRPDSFTSNEPSNTLGHPCPKPLGVMKWIIKRCSMEGETVLDCFAGSGTTGVAALQTKRKFVGIELDKGYFDIALKRITDAARAANGQPKVLAGTANDYAETPLFAGMG